MDRGDLLDGLVASLEADPRVRALWLAGSLARGIGDRLSDIDLVLAVADSDRESLLADWRSLVDPVAPLVLDQRIDTGASTVLTHVTVDWLRYDVVLLPPQEALHTRNASGVGVLVDHDGLQARLRPYDAPQSPSPDRVGSLVREFLRVLGLLPVVLDREEYVVAASGSALVRGLLVQLMTEDVEVEDRGGALRLRGLVPEPQLAALAALPPIEATRESAIAVHLACARLFLPLARDLAARTGVEWPAPLEAALRSHLRRELGLELPPC